jgi:hypothetical protein
MRTFEVYDENTSIMREALRKQIKEYVKKYHAVKSIPMFHRLTYPNVIIVDTTEFLGRCSFDENVCTIQIAEKVIHDTMCADVLGHEVAHFLDHNKSGHGEEFKAICAILGVPTTARRPIDCINTIDTLLTKIQKLLALSESSNVHEAETAMIMARKLMHKYGITEVSPSQKIWRTVLTAYSNYTAEYKTITRIVAKMTGTYIVLDKQYESNYIRAHGTRTQLEIAGYLFDYLHTELATLYKKARKEGNLQGNAKSAFYYGILRSMDARFKEQDNTEGWGLVVSNTVDDLVKKFIYDEPLITSKSKSTRIGNVQAYNMGQKAGKTLQIRQGVAQKQTALSIGN